MYSYLCKTNFLFDICNAQLSHWTIRMCSSVVKCEISLRFIYFFSYAVYTFVFCSFA